MITISLCMIVRNEEDVLARCLDAASQFADEIILVDTGSEDSTVEIAHRYTPHVYAFRWIDDFSAARNVSFARATCDYILWLDADDVVDEENIRKICELKENFPADVDVGLFRYHVGFDESGNPTFTYFRERLIRRERGFLWQEPVHEYIQISGNTQNFDIAVAHRSRARGSSTRNLNIYNCREQEGAPFSPRATYYHARELMTHGFTEKAITKYRAFLSMEDIWVEDALWACGDLADCLVRTGEEQQALDTLFLSFSRGLPRGEILCRIGDIHMRREQYEEAVYWYSLVLNTPRPQGWGFLSEDHWGFIPHLQLCVLHYRLGHREESLFHHRQAAELRPGHPSVHYNELFFSESS